MFLISKGVTIQSDAIEINSDLQRFPLQQDNESGARLGTKSDDYVDDGIFDERTDFLKDTVSSTNITAKANKDYIFDTDYMIVTQKGNSDPQEEVYVKKGDTQRLPIKRVRRETVVDEGSGISESKQPHYNMYSL